jgi:hypothetical protein
MFSNATVRTSYPTLYWSNIGCDNATTDELWTTEFFGLQADSNQKTHTEHILKIKFRMLHMKCKIVYFAASVPS